MYLLVATMGGSWSRLSYCSKLAVPTSSTPLANYHHTIVESLEGQNPSRSLEEQIEQSKIHWSLLANFDLDADEVAEVNNLEVFKNLQSHPKWGTFFQTFGKDGIGELVMGQKFAEGGQAELYDIEVQWNDPWRIEEDLRCRQKWALKVFKKGTSLRQLQLQWPRGLLQDHMDRVESFRRGDLPKFRYYSDVFRGILLEDGRFAFLMVKEHEDLRHRIDQCMLTIAKNCGPYLKKDEEAIMYRIALGMEWLHSRGIVHRDLKASNVLCTKFETGWTCCVADFECSIGVIGTGFFRAPEILQACKDYSISNKPELFTKQADVYSYGMVCYEILTGRLPFDDYRVNDFDHVLVGKRPKVPEYVDGWIHELLRMCWQSNPVDRPSFGVILEVLLANSKDCREMDIYRRKHEAERAIGISTEFTKVVV